MSLLNNHITKDPIVDWFRLQNIRNTIFEPDKNNYFKKYIFQEIINYKKNFLDQLKQQILSIHPNNVIYQDTGVDKTIQLIKDNYPIVINPHLISKNMI